MHPVPTPAPRSTQCMMFGAPFHTPAPCLLGAYRGTGRIFAAGLEEKRRVCG